MVLDAWLPIGLPLSPSAVAGRAIAAGTDWQIVALAEGGRALLTRPPLIDHWLASGMLMRRDLLEIKFGSMSFSAIVSEPFFTLDSLDRCAAPSNKSEALAFASAMSETRRFDAGVSLQDGIYVEKLSRILPTLGAGAVDNDDIVLGSWLTGGVGRSAARVSATETSLAWLSRDAIGDIVRRAGLQPIEDKVLHMQGSAGRLPAPRPNPEAPVHRGEAFAIPGRRQLTAFFNEHVIDLVQNASRYRSLGLGNPAPIVLIGPPGCGKTFAVDRLIDYLGWPRFSVDASAIASPYIHETSRKIAQLFETASESAPSVMVIDEMDAVLSERSAEASSSHRTEEIAEFLRAIPEAIKAGVLIIGMTNRIDIIDPAIIRRGRFDHVVRVDFADEGETLDLLASLFDGIPLTGAVDLAAEAAILAGRPLSDIAFVVRESARLAARARCDAIDKAHLVAARAILEASETSSDRPRIGFF